MTLALVNTAETPSKSIVLANGSRSEKPLSRVEYRKRFGMTNAAAKRGYPLYLLSLGRGNNTAASAAIAAGDILITGRVFNPETGTGALKYVTKEHKSLVVPATKDVSLKAAEEATAKANERVAKLEALLKANGIEV